MAQKLDYRSAKDEKREGVSPAKRAFFLAFIAHVFVLCIYAPALDDGARLKTCLVVAVGFWVVVGLLLARRRRRPLDASDLVFIALGYPAMLLPCLIARGEL